VRASHLIPFEFLISNFEFNALTILRLWLYYAPHMSMFRNSLRAAITTFGGLADLEESLLHASELVRNCLLAGNKLLVAGNGGSAADGMDFSTEYTCRFSGDRRPFPAMNLATDGTLLAAIGNDYAFEEVFARQIWAFGKPGDVLVVYSTSGKSPNILRALDEAKARGLQSIALLGRDGGPAAGRATVDLIVRTEITARIQEAHKFLAHCICEQVDGDLKKAEG
jgi:D-sedoheptulose 7-phosphate isomerase